MMQRDRPYLNTLNKVLVLNCACEPGDLDFTVQSRNSPGISFIIMFTATATKWHSRVTISVIRDNQLLSFSVEYTERSSYHLSFLAWSTTKDVTSKTSVSESLSPNIVLCRTPPVKNFCTEG